MREDNRHLMEDNFQVLSINKYMEIENKMAIKRKDESESILKEKCRNINDLHRQNIYLSTKAE